MPELAIADRCLLCFDPNPPNYEAPSGILCHEDCWEQYEIDHNGDNREGGEF